MRHLKKLIIASSIIVTLLLTSISYAVVSTELYNQFEGASVKITGYHKSDNAKGWKIKPQVGLLSYAGITKWSVSHHTAKTTSIHSRVNLTITYYRVKYKCFIRTTSGTLVGGSSELFLSCNVPLAQLPFYLVQDESTGSKFNPHYKVYLKGY